MEGQDYVSESDDSLGPEPSLLPKEPQQPVPPPKKIERFSYAETDQQSDRGAPSYTFFIVSIAAWVAVAGILGGAYAAAKHNGLFCPESNVNTSLWRGYAYGLCQPHTGTGFLNRDYWAVDAVNTTNYTYIVLSLPESPQQRLTIYAKHGNYSYPPVSRPSCQHPPTAGTILWLDDSDESTCSGSSFVWRNVSSSPFFTICSTNPVVQTASVISSSHGAPPILQINTSYYATGSCLPLLSSSYDNAWNSAALTAFATQPHTPTASVTQDALAHIAMKALAGLGIQKECSNTY